MAVTPFQLTEPFSMDSFNSRISEINAMFGGLGNEYVWEKTTQVTEGKYDESVLIYSSGNIIVASYQGAPTTYYYSESFELSSDGTSFVLTNPKSFTNSKSNYAQLGQYDVLKGKYVIIGATSSNFMDFYPSDCSIYATTVNTYTTVVASTKTQFSNPRKETKVTKYGYVNSPDPNAYPPAVSDGYTYTPLGQIGTCAHIETGTYVGTGTNACSIQYERTPKFVAIFSKTTTNSSDEIPFAFFMPEIGVGVYTRPSGSQNSYCNKVSCYLKDNAFKTSEHYMDISGRTYQYIMLS